MESDKIPGSSPESDRTANQAASDRPPTEGGGPAGTDPETADLYQDEAEGGAAQGGKGRVD